MPRRTQAREKAIETATQLFQQQGYHGTGLAQILAQSGAPRGSFYFHFPGGKQELALEVIRASSLEVEHLFIAARAKARSPGHFVRLMAKGLGRWLEDVAFKEGCPVATLTLEMVPASPELQTACHEVYTRWQALVADAIEAGCADRARAERHAALIVAAFEGALLLGRAQGSAAPVALIGRELSAYIEEATS